MDLKDRLNYNPDTGEFTWKTYRLKSKYKAGDRAGYLDNNGYRRIKLNKVRYSEHRLAIYFMTNEWPIEVDHINLDRSDNRWCNLRPCTSAQNKANRKPRGITGFTGVVKSRKRFMAKGYNRKYLGTFDTPEQAAEASYKHRSEVMGEFFHG